MISKPAASSHLITMSAARLGSRIATAKSGSLNRSAKTSFGSSSLPITAPMQTDRATSRPAPLQRLDPMKLAYAILYCFKIAIGSVLGRRPRRARAGARSMGLASWFRGAPAHPTPKKFSDRRGVQVGSPPCRFVVRRWLWLSGFCPVFAFRSGAWRIAAACRVDRGQRLVESPTLCRGGSGCRSCRGCRRG
jgi:hypothetical protein